MSTYTDKLGNEWEILSVTPSDIPNFIVCDVRPVGELKYPARVPSRRLRIFRAAVVCNVVSEPPSVEHVPVAIAAH